jgi:hypothetical protein
MDANEHKYHYFNLCLFVFIRGFIFPLSSFLFSLFYFMGASNFVSLRDDPDRHLPRHLNNLVAYPAHVKFFYIRNTSSSDNNGSISTV